MKKQLEKLAVFQWGLGVLAFLARRRAFAFLASWLTSAAARLNLSLNRPAPADNAAELARKWQEMMPPDGRGLFVVRSVEGEVAFAEIHLHCPLRGTGDVHACYRLMNYDRTLMESIGGQLVVLESQSNSGQHFCRLAIYPKDASISGLTPAHLA